MEKVKISTRQFTCMLFSLLLSSLMFGLPRILIEQSKQDVWQVMLITFVVDALLAIVYFILGMRYPQQTMFEYSETVLGPWLGKIIGLLFVLFFGYMLLVTLKIVSEFVFTVLLTETPELFINFILLLVSFYAVNAGLEVIARLSEIVAPLILIPLLIILTFSLNRVELENLRPIFQHSIWQLLKYSLLPISMYGVCIVMGIFMAYHNKPKESLKAKWIAIGSVTVLSIMTLISLITIFGTSYSSQQIYPVFRLAQIIKVGNFFERIETLVIIFQIAGAFVGLVIFYYSSVLGLAQIFKIQRYQTLTPYFGVIMLILSKFVFNNIAERHQFTETIFPYLALFIEVFLIIMLLIVSLIRHGIKKT
ncbi:endospore germination permease [Desulfosporosinus sp. OT]|uniref:GerAB/ArcD/ProY family transporter n=1 Tax=Desulfosporosinus sp. OT TaxID=913865 RepID=UPI000310C61D|nr:endospore germination permease [Desulfosporosinus sp. OT]